MNSEFDRLRDEALRVPIADVVGWYGIALKRVGSQQEGPCPVCSGTNRFVVSWVGNKELFYCRGCKVGGRVVKLIRHIENVGERKAVKILTGDDHPRQTAAPTPPPAKPKKSDAERTQYAMDKWCKARPAAGTLVETYLRWRGIILPPPLDFALRIVGVALAIGRLLASDDRARHERRPDAGRSSRKIPRPRRSR